MDRAVFNFGDGAHHFGQCISFRTEFVLYRFGDKSILIGDNDDTRIFARNLARERQTRVLLYADTAQDTGRSKSYGEDGVALLTHDWRQPPDRETRAQIRGSHFNTARHIVLLYEEDLDNYAVFMTLIQSLKPQRPIKMRVRCKSQTLRDLMQSMLRQAQADNEALRYLDIRFLTLRKWWRRAFCSTRKRLCMRFLCSV